MCGRLHSEKQKKHTQSKVKKNSEKINGNYMNNKDIDAFFNLAKHEAERLLFQYSDDDKSSGSYQHLRNKLEEAAVRKVRELARGELKFGEVLNEWDFVESEANFSALFKGNYNPYLYASFFLYHWGIYIYSTGECLSSLRFMIQASTYAGYWKGARERDEWLQAQEVAKQTKIDNGKKVGDGRAAYFQPVREELIRLLMTECPAEGWRFKTKAAEAISGKLQIFIDTHEFELKADNLENTILRWSSKYPDIEVAFARVLRKND